MTVMDKIDGWEDEENWVGSKIAACTWIYTETVPCDGQDLPPLSVMERVNWVCEEAFEKQESVSELTSSIQEEVWWL